ncbi:MAG: CHASE domain-containing protein, partial [Burkholderiales bacterium]
MRPAPARFSTRNLAAWVVLAFGVALSAIAAYLVLAQVEREARLKFGSVVSDAQAAIELRIRAYANILLGVRGLFGTDSVSRDEFRRYIGSFDLQHRYPGVQVVHYSRRISAAEKEGFEATVRNDTSVDPAGYPNFRIRTPGDRPEYVVAEYVEPMTGNERALGLDLGGDPVRLAALEHTRDSGQL